MSYLVRQVEAQLRASVINAAERAAAAGSFAALPTGDFRIEVPQNRDFGDFSANAAMVWAKELRQPPRAIAQALAEQLDLSGTYFEKVDFAGAGFLNFYLSAEYYAAILLDIHDKGADYGRSDWGAGRRINVEFVSANPTGPMHMGNARGGALGDCLAAVLERAGCQVSREFYVNDAGNQIAKFALSLDVRYRQLLEGTSAPALPEDAYQGADITALAKAYADEHGDGLLRLGEDERRRALAEYALPKNLAAMRSTMAKYRIEYDRWFFESELHGSGQVAALLDDMAARGLTYEKDGAIWLKSINNEQMTNNNTEDENGAGKDEVLVRANGIPTYFAADIAYHRDKLLTRGFDEAIDIWGADHHGHVARMQAALDAIGLDGSRRLKVILMQLVRLMSGGEVARMSKRTGNAITLTDLLEDIPVDAARFLFNLREPETQMEFDLDLAVQQSAQNPVYYCQYAHARACSVIRKLEESGRILRACTAEELALLTAPEERDLIAHLAALTGETEAAARLYDPAKITRYCLELSTLYHKFYAACRVNCEEKTMSAARLFLCDCVRSVLHSQLTLFKITAPKEM
ncbi:MAG: arginine--tRNA ligase [Oscillospiraceae bacterium]|jgi:arginyl-tRNA synthetase|nr:arginine--tRNA ligase [Oscillospiraceae bacterium]